MFINTKALLDVLHMLRHGIAPKAIVLQSDCFVFQKNIIYSYNDEIAISHPFKIEINGAVPAKQLLNFLEKIEEEEIKVTQKDNFLLVKGGNYRAKIKIILEITLPVKQETGHFNALPYDFTTAIKFCLFSCSKDQTKPALTCIHVHQGRVESSDSFRMTIRYLDDDKCFSKPILIPHVAAKSLVTFDVVEYSTSPGWLHFKTENEVVFSCRTYISMTFPNIQRIIDVEGEQVDLPKKLNNVIKRANALIDNGNFNNPRISLTIGNGKFIVKSKGNFGYFEENCSINYKGESKNIKVHPEYLAQIIELCNVMEISKNQLRFEGDDGEFVHVFVCFT